MTASLWNLRQVMNLSNMKNIHRYDQIFLRHYDWCPPIFLMHRWTLRTVYPAAHLIHSLAACWLTWTCILFMSWVPLLPLLSYFVFVLFFVIAFLYCLYESTVMKNSDRKKERLIYGERILPIVSADLWMCVW